jgi:hypothetical protein
VLFPENAQSISRNFQAEALHFIVEKCYFREAIKLATATASSLAQVMADTDPNAGLIRKQRQADQSLNKGTGFVYLTDGYIFGLNQYSPAVQNFVYPD